MKELNRNSTHFIERPWIAGENRDIKYAIASLESLTTPHIDATIETVLKTRVVPQLETLIKERSGPLFEGVYDLSKYLFWAGGEFVTEMGKGVDGVIKTATGTLKAEFAKREHPSLREAYQSYLALARALKDYAQRDQILPYVLKMQEALDHIYRGELDHVKSGLLPLYDAVNNFIREEPRDLETWKNQLISGHEFLREEVIKQQNPIAPLIDATVEDLNDKLDRNFAYFRDKVDFYARDMLGLGHGSALTAPLFSSTAHPLKKLKEEVARAKDPTNRTPNEIKNRQLDNWLYKLDTLYPEIRKDILGKVWQKRAIRAGQSGRTSIYRMI